MKERKPLIEGIKASVVDTQLERDFVYGGKTETPKAFSPKVAEILDQKNQPPINRVPLTTRIREDFYKALKTESLQRQLNGKYPYSLQEVLEEALETWMREHGCLI